MNLKPIICAFVLAGSLAALSGPTQAAEGVTPPRESWSFSGPFGKYDEGQLQRGFKVYREVCAACHSLKLVAFRNLAEAGGPGFSEAQAKQIASEYQIKDLNDKGEQIERPGLLADHFPSPFPNELAAAANFGVAPPDLSTMGKARTYERGFPWFVFDMFTQYQEQGPDYISAFLQGYGNPPTDFKVPEGGSYNKYFPGHSTAMPPPMQAGQVKYDDGSPETVAQYSRDVTAFMMWAAEPHMVARKRIGFQVMIFLIVLSGLLYFTKKKVWRDVHHKEGSKSAA